ncbi:hypothetical protein GCM10011519_03040 [Marmoricola endophyticus]|uniref:C-type lectin domain-containing protein n=1 Tax=Marmoricola endophyticus TaxID=2040280 RepID=A0A917EYR0_9ACTN|nr:IPT/TIG domain-containing protein [Marmoricola endophyticus]GGF32977.1 hypothetical protein GCM10011519_03040 [Marmoricola endophyticus]
MNRTFHRGLAALGAAGIAATVLGTTGTAQADTTFTNPANGHTSTYAAVGGYVTWADARDVAAATPASAGCTNHLAVLTSEAEKSFVDDTLGLQGGYWLGGVRDRSAEGAPFTWVTGEAFDYTNWDAGEPNDYLGSEDYVQLAAGNRWNDIYDSYQPGYVLETECVPLQRAVVTGVTPASGSRSGGTSVTITGEHFTGAKQVTFGGVAATSYAVVSDTEITATTPAYSGAVSKKGRTVQLRVQTKGSNVKSKAARFTYIADAAARR